MKVIIKRLDLHSFIQKQFPKIVSGTSSKPPIYDNLLFINQSELWHWCVFKGETVMTQLKLSIYFEQYQVTPSFFNLQPISLIW